MAHACHKHRPSFYDERFEIMMLTATDQSCGHYTNLANAAWLLKSAALTPQEVHTLLLQQLPR